MKEQDMTYRQLLIKLFGEKDAEALIKFLGTLNTENQNKLIEAVAEKLSEFIKKDIVVSRMSIEKGV